MHMLMSSPKGSYVVSSQNDITASSKTVPYVCHPKKAYLYHPKRAYLYHPKRVIHISSQKGIICVIPNESAGFVEV